MANPDDVAFAKLEQRVLGMLTDLRDAKRRETEALRAAAELREALAEKEQEIERLRSAGGESERNREAIRERIESLLGRVDELEQDE